MARSEVGRPRRQKGAIICRRLAVLDEVARMDLAAEAMQEILAECEALEAAGVNDREPQLELHLRATGTEGMALGVSVREIARLLEFSRTRLPADACAFWLSSVKANAMRVLMRTV